MPKCKYIQYNAFKDCYNLQSVNLPECSYIGASAFTNCSSLQSIDLPACSYIGYSAFTGCYNLRTISLPDCGNIGDFAFKDCYNLSKIYLTGSSICSLSSTYAFFSTPFDNYSVYFNGTPHIYVPSSLVSAYKTASNWRYYSKYFVGI